jgi:hypothetical protein
MNLIYDNTGVEAEIGDTVVLSEEIATIVWIREPHKPSSTGRVEVMLAGGFTMEYFPSVIKAHWEK